MKSIKTIFLLLVLSGLAFIGFGAFTSLPETLKPKASKLPIYISNVAIVDVINDEALENQYVLITDGRIQKISSTAIDLVDSKHIAIDGSNKFLMPGLWDMHVHTIEHSDLLHFPLYIASGVLNVRDLGNTCSWGSSKNCIAPNDKWQTMIDDNLLLGPKQWAQVSYHMEEVADLNVTAQLEHLRDVQDSLLKLQIPHETTNEQFQSLLDQAEDAGLPVVGHLPGNLNLADLNLSNLASIEHDRALYSYCATVSGNFEERVSVMEAYADRYDAVKCQTAMAYLTSQNVSYTPTHIASSMQDINIIKRSYKASGHDKYIDSITLFLWSTYAWLTDIGFDESDKASLQALNRTSFEITKLAQSNNVLLLAGSDAIDAFIYPGISLYDELELLSQAGLSNIEVIRSATLNPAKHVNAENDLGSVNEGKLADLILLGKNPLNDLSAIRDIDSVIYRGELYEHSELDEMKAYTARVAKNVSVTAKRTWQLIFD